MQKLQSKTYTRAGSGAGRVELVVFFLPFRQSLAPRCAPTRRSGDEWQGSEEGERERDISSVLSTFNHLFPFVHSSLVDYKISCRG